METKNILTNPSYNMELSQVFKSLLLLQIFLNTFIFIHAAPLFREYIGAEDKNVKFSDVPINPNVDFHFILSFALDYTDSRKPKSTNGDFRVNWDSKNLSPAHVSEIKKQFPNVKVAMSLGGDTVGDRIPVEFDASSVESWVKNAETSISRIVKDYDLDGIDIDYEHFKKTEVGTFVECIGTLLSNLKSKNIISFASIAPYDDHTIQRFYLALWKKHGDLIDYVNFQFYAYGKMKSSALFLQYFEKQSLKYKGGKILVSFGTDGSGGLSPKNGFFHACKILGDQGKLYGIFIWSADDSKRDGFQYEKRSQDLLGKLK